ncbi:MAG: hypothetical protein KF774_01150 [Planctomyces sp.]|nr:hypothetical protein [Planctomyces sp.]
MSRRCSLAQVRLTLAAAMFAACAGRAFAADPPFAIHVVDDQTGRGVPLVELKTTADSVHITDSHGLAAIDEPALAGQTVFFEVSSHGYEFPKDGLGFRGRAVKVEPGNVETFRIQRTNIAERLYRITGAGIYRDSVKLGRDVPIRAPVLNAQVAGQDTVQCVVRGDRIHWFWGDTDKLSYPLGQFNTSGAVSLLPGAGGLDPSVGIDLEYFTGVDGFSRPMFRRENGVLIWVHGAFSLTDPDGRERILTHYSRRKSLADELSSGLAVLNDETNVFEPLFEYDERPLPTPRGQALRIKEGNEDYIAFATPYVLVRVPARWEAATDPLRWESWTPLPEGALWSRGPPPELDRDDAGRVRFGWKAATSPVDARQMRSLVRDGLLSAEENPFRTVDAADGKEVQLHAGSVRWNEHRQRWVMIAHETYGGPSFLGEVWYAESRRPEGPFARGVKIVTHDKYSFYNVTHHDFFDQDDGRRIHFEGTYTNLFTENVPRTPWYDYNQILYGLDLDDPRLAPAHAE